MLTSPLILTLSIEKDAAFLFNSLRKKYFPPSRNFIDAHITLFHALPDDAEIENDIQELCSYQKSFQLQIQQVVSIGKGVAYKLESNELMQLHKTLQNKWHLFLSGQDRQKLWPHITVQNKVPLQEAQKLLFELKRSFTPFSTSATGLQLWQYLNGPWKFVEFFSFRQ